MRIFRRTLITAAALAAIALVPGGAGASAASQDPAQEPLTLRTMGSFFFGGTVERDGDGTTFHGDHGYAQYYIPAKSRHLPVVMWHGIGQSGKTFESTPDGREGFQALLPRRGWSVYIIDQPRRGRAGYTRSAGPAGSIPTTAAEWGVWNAFRNGLWIKGGRPTLYAGSQFPLSGAAVDQFFRQQTPDTGAEPLTAEWRAYMGKTAAALFERTGDGILVTHSNSGQYGWEAAMQSPCVKAVVAFEPGAFAFPEEEPPADVPAKTEAVGRVMFPRMVPMQKWQALARIPILVVYGDNISDEPSDVFNVDVWRISRERARQFVELVNRHGGNATLLELPKAGIRGNTHAAFADKNSLEVLGQVERWLKANGLDGWEAPHAGPAPLVKPLDIDLEESRG